VLPSLAILGMPPTEQKKKVRCFKSPIPTREVSIVYSRSYLKKSIIEALYSEVVASLPEELKKAKSNERVIKIPSFQ
jgi:LysR family hydrogen peroxide-inducible transcriptional activator